MSNKNTSFEELLVRKKAPADKKSEDVQLPVQGGRQTVPEGVTTIGAFLAELASVTPDFNLQLLKAMEYLAIHHSEVSYAVDNIVQLGNTVGTFPNNITFDDNISDELQKEMITRLKSKSKRWYSFSGGVNSITNDLLAQVAVNGALSAEIVPNISLDGVDKVVLVSPKTIRFRYEKESNDYVPYQVNNSIESVYGTRLNTITYKYDALRRITEKPYGIPPFISALESISIGKDMVENLKHVVKKMGVLGFLEVLVNGPKPTQGESDDAYYKRTKKYLDDVVPEIEKGLSKGFAVGFKNSHEFKMQNVTQNAQGAKDLIETNDIKMMAGLKQDPLMFGRNFSTTETLGRVVLAKMTTQVGNYQRKVENFLEQLFLMDLQLAGYPITVLEIEFDAPMIGDQHRHEEMLKLKFERLKGEYAQGLISQGTFAIEMEREKPDQEEPRPIAAPLLPVGPDGLPPNKEDTTKTDDKKKKDKKSNTAFDYWFDLKGHFPEYEYDVKGCNCGSMQLGSEDERNKDLQKFIAQYYKGTKQNYDAAVDKVTVAIGKGLEALGPDASVQSINDVVFYHLYKNWGEAFTIPQKRTVNKFIKTIYGFFKKDKRAFGNSDDIPDSTFSTLDLRAIEYYKRVDSVYLGKFVTDEDLKKKITAYIKQEYLNGDLAIGNDSAAIAKFKKEFGDLMEGQDWKLTRILSTTVNKLRNTAAVSYMQDADIEQYEIVGINDSLQCGYCSALQGTKFSVEKSVDQVNQMVKSDPELVGLDSPFITAVFKSPDDLDGLSSQQLQDKGIGLPPYHPHCRDQVVAIL